MTLYANGKVVGYCNEIEECILPIKDVEVSEKLKLIKDPFEATIEVSPTLFQSIMMRFLIDELAWQMASKKMHSLREE